jgi:hypothetical protein
MKDNNSLVDSPAKSKGADAAALEETRQLSYFDLSLSDGGGEQDNQQDELSKAI